MAEFTFLNDEGDDYSGDQNKDWERPVRVPKGYRVQEPGKDYKLSDQEWAREGDELVPPTKEDLYPKNDPKNFSVSSPKSTIQGQKSVRAAQANALAEYSRVVNDIASKSTKKTPDNILSMNPSSHEFDPSDWFERGKGKDPESLYSLAKNAMQMGDVPNVPLDGLEAAITAYNKLAADPNAEDKAALQQEDQKSQESYAKLEAEKNSLLEKAKFAPTSLRQQYAEKAQQIQRQQDSMGDKMRTRPGGNEQGKGSAFDQELEMPFGEPKMDTTMDLNSIFVAAGAQRSDIVKAGTELRRMAMMKGISPTDKVTPMTFPIIYSNMIAEYFKPAIAKEMLDEINPPRPPAAKKGDEGKMVSDDLENDRRFQNVNRQIDDREARRDRVWEELAHSGTFQNVGDVIGFILVSLLCGPKFSSIFFSNMNKNGNLRHELDALDRETTQLYHQQDSYIQLQNQARHQAATEEEQQGHNRQMEGYYYARLKKMGSRIVDPQAKAIASAKLHSARLADQNVAMESKKLATLKASLDRLEKIGSLESIRDPEHEAAKGKLAQARKDFGVAQAKYNKYLTDMQRYKAELMKWFEANAQKIGDMTPQAQPQGGTKMDEETFDQ